MESPKRAAVYARTATTQENGPNFAMAEQIHQCKEYCIRKGYQVTDVYEEVGSGNKADRKAVLTALNKAQAGKFEVLVIRDFNRLARKTELLTNLIERFDEAGVKVESVTEEVSLVSMMKAIKEEVAKMQRDKIATRTRAGRQAKRTQSR